jgi:outer membrane protein assembly factor BamB
MAALSFNRTTGFKKLWDVPMIPEDISGVGKWSGAAVWGGQPPIDDEYFNTVFIATGNTYAVPKEVEQQCSNSTTTNSSACLPSNVWQNSVIALDATTGKSRWIQQLGPLDAWTLACGIQGSNKLNPGNCPQKPGPDADFGMAPAYVSGYFSFVPQDPGSNDILVVGQKNGNLYTINPKNGHITWTTLVGPGGIVGGLSWGVAVDRHNIYYTVVNSDGLAWQVQPSGQATNSSAWGAVNTRNGTIIWETVAEGDGRS